MGDITIIDTNTFASLVEGCLEDAISGRRGAMHITDLALHSLKNGMYKKAAEMMVGSGALYIKRFDGAGVKAVARLYHSLRSRGNVSLGDCSLLKYAQETGGTLITGDGRLYDTARQLDIRTMMMKSADYNYRQTSAMQAADYIIPTSANRPQGDKNRTAVTA